MPNDITPVIIIGMHRSGTSMITQLLKKLGLFVGKRLDYHYEALFFQKINIWLLQLAGAHWSRPAPLKTLLSHSLLRKQCIEVIRYWLSARVYLAYLGIWNSLRYHSIFNLPFVWGWKDPRSTITLPIWLDIFPQAKIVYIIRNGVDVASSLSRRAGHMLENSLFNHSKKDIIPKAYWKSHQGSLKYFHLPIIVDSARCLSLESSFELWEEYMRIADQNLQNIPEKQKIKIQYEDLLINSIERLSQVCRFLELSASSERIEYLCKKYIFSDRANAYKGKPELERFYSKVRCRDYMKKYGY
jgi:hypothetical protein